MGKINDCEDGNRLLDLVLGRIGIYLSSIAARNSFRILVLTVFNFLTKPTVSHNYYSEMLL